MGRNLMIPLGGTALPFGMEGIDQRGFQRHLPYQRYNRPLMRQPRARLPVADFLRLRVRLVDRPRLPILPARPVGQTRPPPAAKLGRE
jgi:hypothetical protein